MLLIALLIVANTTFSQALPPYLEGKVEYPVFDFHPWVGVVKSDAQVLKYDKKLNYRLAIDVTDGVKDSTSILSPLLEVARSYNLNIANGVPQKKLDVTVVIHGSAIWGMLNEDAYQEKYGVENPNLEVIKTLKKEGIEFYVCAQVLAFRNVEFDEISKDVDLAVSAKTALITLDQMGYSYLNVNEN